MYLLGETEGAIETLTRAKELFTSESEILYRLVGLHSTLLNEENAKKELLEALQIDHHKNYILKDLFPYVWENKHIQAILTNYKP